MLAVVTGSNRGFGLALCEALQDRGATVLAACRTSSPELASLEVEVVSGVDVGTDDGVEALGTVVDGRQLDLVLVNAGIVRSMGLDDLDVEGIREQIEVNAIGALRTVRAVVPALREGATICMISSLAGSIGDNGAGGEYGYRMSKAALNMAAVSLSHDLADRGVRVISVHPGRLATRNLDEDGPGVRMPVSPDVAPPAVAASELLDLLAGLSHDVSGVFLNRSGETIPW
jgi:NAD(P)-dependent dehydrogenase (short-subunit alcohol dehydrogenase family)